MQFNSLDPFPLPSLPYSYAAAKLHAAEVDQWLDLRAEQVEAEILRVHGRDRPESKVWRGLPVQSLLTPYQEVRWMLQQANAGAGSKVVDLGCAYGRMAHVVGRHFPQLEFIGFECVGERVEEGLRVLQKHAYPNVQLVCADITHPLFHLPLAQVYFVYDFADRRAIMQVLERLREIAISQSICVIGRGRATRDAIENTQPWLSQVREPEHFATFSIYRS